MKKYAIEYVEDGSLKGWRSIAVNSLSLKFGWKFLSKKVFKNPHWAFREIVEDMKIKPGQIILIKTEVIDK